MIHLGNVPAGSTLYIPFATYDANGASVTISNFAVTDIEIYKNGSTTQRASDNGYTLLDTDGIDFDSQTGIHGFSVDLSDNSDASFYAAGSTYWIMVGPFTVNAQTVNAIVATFRIVSAEGTAGVPVADVTRINNIAATSVTTINANVGTTQPENFTGTGASALVKVDAVDIAGAAVSTSTAQIGVNVVNFGGSAGTFASGRPEVNTTHIAGSAVSASTAQIGVNVVNFGGSAGTFASGRPETNTTHIAGSAVSTSSAQIGVNVVNAGATAWNSGAIKTTSFTAGAIDAAAIATDAIGAAELAADAVTEIGTGVWATATRTLTSSLDPTSAQVATAVLTTQMTEAYSADGAAPTLAQALMLIQQMLGDFSISGTTLTVKKVDGSTTAATFTLDSSSAPTSITRAT